MAIFPNIINEFRPKIIQAVKFDDAIDELIACEIIDEKQYCEIWAHKKNRYNELISFVTKDGHRCEKFIELLKQQAHDLYIQINDDICRVQAVTRLGEFPDFPLNFVVRNSIADNVKQEVLNLKNNIANIASVLVVHGAPGFGKSYLVNQVLQNKVFADFSNGAMFWISLGEHQNETNVIYALWNLYQNISKLSNKPQLPHCPDKVDALKRELKDLMQQPSLQNTILILDDVKSSEILQIFKLNCKLVITTQDKDVANASNARFIHLTTGFTEKESLELLSKSLESSLECLSKAGDIHRACSGCPMLVNIIGSILRDSREEALASPALWDDLLAEIRGSYSLRDPTTKTVMRMIEKCVERLDPPTRRFFNRLSVFGQHVNIKTAILARLWGRTQREVRRIMVGLEHKSLVVSFYHKHLQQYVYSIHSLIFTYLQQNEDDDYSSDHCKLLQLYDDIKCDTPYNDPISQYVLGYYGHHAKNGGNLAKFEKFLEFEFVERKIKFVGSADLLNDYNNYEWEITGGVEALKHKLEDLKKITIDYSSHLHVSPETNIIQYVILYGDCSNRVYEEAEELARAYYDRLYFKLSEYSKKNKISSVLTNHAHISVVAFLDTKSVLIGYESGLIELKHFDQYEQNVQKFQAHTGRILNFLPSPNKRQFLSISQDYTAKLWNFEQDLDPQSPRCKQFDWRELHLPADESTHTTFKMTDDIILSAAFPNLKNGEMVSGSCRGKVVQWNTKNGTPVREFPERGLEIPCILYAHNDLQLFFCCNGHIFLYSIDNQYQGQLGPENVKLMLLSPDTNNQLVVLCDSSVEIWNYANKSKLAEFKLESIIVSSVISHRCCLVATSDYKLSLVDLTGLTVERFDNNFGLPNALFYLPNQYIAFVCIEDKSLQRCQISLRGQSTPSVKALSKFDVYWLENVPILAIANDNCLELFSGGELTHRVVFNDHITTCHFSANHKLIYVATRAYFYTYDLLQHTMVERVIEDKIVEVKCFDRLDNELVVLVLDRGLAIDKQLVSFESEYVNCHNSDDSIVLVEQNRLIVFEVDTFQVNTEIEVGDVCLSEFSVKRALLALVTLDYTLKLYKFEVNRLKLASEVGTAKLKTLAFSFDGCLLAGARLDGAIDVYFLNEAAELSGAKLVTLTIHSTVERLLFAPFVGGFLVSLGDQIAWWNLNAFVEGCKEGGVVERGQKWSLLGMHMKGKKVHELVPFLLNSTNLHGEVLTFVTASLDFKHFLVVDHYGSIFKMDLLT